MKILNLVYPDKSDIKFEISKFPDGQQQVKILDDSAPFFKWGYVEIKARLNDFKDLELVICATQSLRNLGIKEIHLYTPYFLGSRSDRQFEEGSNNYLKQVICPIINSLGFESVTVLDPHSDVLEACLNGFKRVSNRSLVDYAMASLNLKTNEFVLVSPDAGASKKIYKIAEQIGYKGNIITCSKDRDINGKLTKTIVPLNNLGNKNLIIIDDICDGGATFINISGIIREHYIGNSCPKIHFIVTHGIFSKGYDKLTKYFDSIYTTNSYQDYPITNRADILNCVKPFNNVF